MSGLKRVAGCTGIYVGMILGLAVLAAAPQQQAQQPPPAGAQTPAQPPPPSLAAVERASTILAEARKAMGGPALDSIKTLTASGRTRRVRGNNLVPIEFEIGIELPDKYYRKDEFPAEETDPTSQGFNGDGLIQMPLPAAPPPAAGRPGGPPAPTPAQIEAQRRARVNSIKQDFVRFALGMFAASLDAYPVTFAFAAQAEAPQGKADVLDVRAKTPQAGPNAFALKFFIHSETHLPIMVSWLLPPTNVIVTVPGQPPPATIAPGAVVISAPAPPAAGASQEEKDAYQKTVAGLQAKARQTPVEHRLYFADYRDVNGVKLPFRLRRAIGTDTTEETTFDRYQINGKIDPRRFQIVK